MYFLSLGFCLPSQYYNDLSKDTFPLLPLFVYVCAVISVSMYILWTYTKGKDHICSTALIICIIRRIYQWQHHNKDLSTGVCVGCYKWKNQQNKSIFSNLYCIFLKHALCRFYRFLESIPFSSVSQCTFNLMHTSWCWYYYWIAVHVQKRC